VKYRYPNKKRHITYLITLTQIKNSFLGCITTMDAKSFEVKPTRIRKMHQIYKTLLYFNDRVEKAAKEHNKMA